MAIVDDEDYDRVNRFRWFAHKGGNGVYAARNMPLPRGKKTTKFLHHEVLGYELERGLVVDHRDHNPLNCRKGNLRLCTKAQNVMNQGPRRDKRTSKYKGVYKLPARPDGKNRWQAVIRFRGKAHYLGCFYDELPAVKIYNVWARRLHGPFAYLNNWDGPTLCEIPNPQSVVPIDSPHDHLL
jgi:hypothetical protein